MTTKVEIKVSCDECGAFLAKHVALRADGKTEYGWLQIAKGMVATGKRTFGPSPRPRGLPRSSKPLMVKIPGPVTLRCLRCGTARETVVGPGTMLLDSTA